MRTRMLAAALVTASLSSPAAADLRTFVEICGDPESAPGDVLNHCQRAIDTGSLDLRATAQAQTNMGAAQYELGRYTAAVQAHSAALENHPRFVDALLNRAKAYERLRDLRAAMRDYSAALALDPSSSDAYMGRGVLLLRNGDPQRSIPDFSQAIALRPTLVAAQFNRGLAHLQLGLAREADRDFSFVLRRTPSDTGALLNRARARALLGRPGALEDFDRAIELDPEWGAAWYARGSYHEARGETEPANQDFLRAYELGVNDPWLNQRVQTIIR